MRDTAIATLFRRIEYAKETTEMQAESPQKKRRFSTNIDAL